MKGIILRILLRRLRGLVSFAISSNLRIIDLIETEDEPGLLKYPRLFMLASQLEVSGLKTLALERFQSQLRGDWRVEDLVDCIEEIYKNQNQNQYSLLLRPIVAEAALAYFLKRLVATVFIKGLKEIEDFRTDLMSAQIGLNLSGENCHPRGRVGFIYIHLYIVLLISPGSRRRERWALL